MILAKIHNIYTCNKRSLMYIRQILLEQKGKKDFNTIILGDFSASFYQWMSKHTSGFNHTKKQMDLTEIYRSLHPKPKEHPPFSSSYGIFLGWTTY